MKKTPIKENKTLKEKKTKSRKSQTHKIKKQPSKALKVKKSTIARSPKDKPRSFVVCASKEGKHLFLRFVARLVGNENIVYDISYVKTISKASKFTTQESAKTALSQINSLQRLTSDLKVLECEKAKNLLLS